MDDGREIENALILTTSYFISMFILHSVIHTRNKYNMRKQEYENVKHLLC